MMRHAVLGQRSELRGIRGAGGLRRCGPPGGGGRAARWDGAIPAMAGIEAARTPDVSEVRELVLFLRGCRAENGLADRPFDIVVEGMSPGGTAGRDLTGPLADLGVTCGMSGCRGVMT
jgi:hypothetical protein